MKAIANAVASAEIAADVPAWVQIGQVGRWLGHPAGPETVSRDMLMAAKGYFERHFVANGVDLLIDYHHASTLPPAAENLARAAGWIQEMELRQDGAELWGKVMWTTQASNAIRQREFRYLSPVLRFNAPDRVSGEPVPLQIPSVALTNTPFLTELEALNDTAGANAGTPTTPDMGGESMTLIEMLAQALDLTPEQVASKLGLTETDDAAVAKSLLGLAERVAALEADAAEETPAVSEEVANALGVATMATVNDVHGAIIRLKAPGAGLGAVRTRLGLEESASEADICNAIGTLQTSHRSSEAEELVDRAVADGKIAPAHRDYYLGHARERFDATRDVINSMPVLTAAPDLSDRQDTKPGMTDPEAHIARLLGLTAEQMAGARA